MCVLHEENEKKKKVVCEKLFCGVESLNQSTRSNNLKNVVHISRGYWLILDVCPFLRTPEM